MADLAALMDRVVAEVDADKAAGVDRTYELRFVGHDDRYTLTFAEGGVTAAAGEGPDGSCRLGVHPEDIEDLLDGKVTLSTLFSSRRLRVFGNVGDAMRLEAVLPPAVG
jgi:alkyl sulfatase BDS1-like metallo-beta-lactamase superfamily hydrolase